MFASLACTAALAATPLKVTGWMVFWNEASLVSFEKNASLIDEVKPEWMGLDEEGMPFVRPYITDEMKARFFAAAKKNKVAVKAMINNFASDQGGFEPKRVQKMLATKERRRKSIDALIALLTKEKLDGVDIDIESLTEGERKTFTLYVQELADAAKRAKKALSITVHPKESEPGNWDGPKAQDWAAIGKAVDSVKIMTYDFSWATSAPGPIAPNDWAERVMTFAKSVIPARKLDMGVAAYGYDWSTSPARSLTWTDWSASEAKSEACPRSGERILGKTYFSGAKAIGQKMDLARKLGVRGIALWYFGSEDPALWDMVRKSRAQGR